MSKAYSYIRWSNKSQARGNSLKRQTTMVDEYCAKHGLVLDTNSRISDRGMSAWKGRNVDADCGALGKFLAEVRAGRIPKGSTLLVENLDRISRQAVGRATKLFLDMLADGIRIVTLTRSPVVFENLDTLDAEKLNLAIDVLTRGNEESATKSERVGKAWKDKREAISTTPLTAQCPRWLRMREDGSGYEIWGERDKIVRRIFDLVEGGMGQSQVAKKLNQDKVPTWGFSGHWSQSYVKLILHSRAVLGEFQPMMMAGRGRERVPVGDPIPGYFPRVIRDEQWHRVQALFGRRKKLVGRGSETLANLFSGLLYCISTRGPIWYRSHSKKSDWNYLISRAAAIGESDLKLRGWRYSAFEKLLLSHCRQIDWSAVFGEGGVCRSLGPLLPRQPLPLRVRALVVDPTR
jgi:DNA invertase Pin-like site-specific DNA recombinase